MNSWFESHETDPNNLSPPAGSQYGARLLTWHDADEKAANPRDHEPDTVCDVAVGPQSGPSNICAIGVVLEFGAPPGGSTDLPQPFSIPIFDDVVVLVVGDVMLDRYWHGETSRISPEAPVPVVKLMEMDEVRPGGAANVAVSIAALGARPVLLGLTGEDREAQTLADLLDQHRVTHRLQARSGYQTVTKLRVLSRHQQLIRLDREGSPPPPSPEESASMARDFDDELATARAVVLSDYGKGALVDVESFIARARAAAVPVVVDPKGADFDRYRGASAVTPNQHELERVVGGWKDEHDLADKAQALCRRLDIEMLLVTRGEQGMSLIKDGCEPHHERARALDVYDVTGAGDTVIAVFTLALGAGADRADAMHCANLAAGVVVGKVGTAYATMPELERAVGGESDVPRGVVTEAELHVAVRHARAAGETIVMTNGCFDLLHAGHVGYLREARSMGGRLIVAVNDDPSVRRLKGSGRPVTALEQRMEVLAALADVDWVVPFADDTPESIICEILPDVLVKGGDYCADEIAGARCVRDQGGRVEVLAYRSGCSTSDILASLTPGRGAKARRRDA